MVSLEPLSKMNSSLVFDPGLKKNFCSRGPSKRGKRHVPRPEPPEIRGGLGQILRGSMPTSAGHLLAKRHKNPTWERGSNSGKTGAKWAWQVGVALSLRYRHGTRRPSRHRCISAVCRPICKRIADSDSAEQSAQCES